MKLVQKKRLKLLGVGCFSKAGELLTQGDLNANDILCHRSALEFGELVIVLGRKESGFVVGNPLLFTPGLELCISYLSRHALLIIGYSAIYVEKGSVLSDALLGRLPAGLVKQVSRQVLSNLIHEVNEVLDPAVELRVA